MTISNQGSKTPMKCLYMFKKYKNEKVTISSSGKYVARLELSYPAHSNESHVTTSVKEVVWYSHNMEGSKEGRSITARSPTLTWRWKVEPDQSERSVVWWGRIHKKALSFTYWFSKVSQFGFRSVTYCEILTLCAVNHKLIPPQISDPSLQPNLNSADTHLLCCPTHSTRGKQACVPG